jgi:hypothetical protein
VRLVSQRKQGIVSKAGRGEEQLGTVAILTTEHGESRQAEVSRPKAPDQMPEVLSRVVWLLATDLYVSRINAGGVAVHAGCWVHGHFTTPDIELPAMPGAGDDAALPALPRPEGRPGEGKYRRWHKTLQLH